MNGVTAAQPLLKLVAIHKTYRKSGLFSKDNTAVMAVRGVSLEVFPGETLGLVGESGCGKSTLGRCALRLIPVTSGQVIAMGQEVTGLRQKALLPFRRQFQIVFQDPYSSLNPRMTVGDILAEPLIIHGIGGDHRTRQKRVAQLLDSVGLPTDSLDRFAHEFSGGQRQRVGLARALAVEPKLIICDEPVSALDVSVQAQTLNLLMDLQDSLGLSYLFISHDLRVVRSISHRVAVMQHGEIVEIAETEKLFHAPEHEYTKELLSSIPQL